MNMHEKARTSIENIAYLIFYGIVGVSMFVIIGYVQFFIFGSFGGMTTIIIESWKAAYLLVVVGFICFLGWAAVSIILSVHNVRKLGNSKDGEN